MADEHVEGKSGRSAGRRGGRRKDRTSKDRAFTCDADFLGATILAEQLFELSLRGLHDKGDGWR